MAPVIFNGKNVCLAGSGKATGIATKTTDGFKVTGQWNYATGSNAASAFTANCLIEENGVLLKNEDDTPLYQSFIFLPEEVTVKQNWKRIGMIATASNRFEIDELYVDKNRSFIIEKEHAVLRDALYQFPFLQFAELTLAVNSSGMAIRFLDLCKKKFEEKASAEVLSRLQNAIQTIQKIRQEFYTVAAAAWQACLTNREINATLLQEISRISKQLAVTSLQLVDALYPSCGIQAANPDTEINRVWRNLHTASQHSLFNR
jgi:alkylation response protein AidB-like acyl-CoA dehydrogenase